MIHCLDKLEIPISLIDQIKIILTYSIYVKNQVSKSHVFYLQFYVSDKPIKIKNVSAQHMVLDVMKGIITPLANLQCGNVRWRFVSIPVFGRDVNRSSYLRVPLRDLSGRNDAMAEGMGLHHRHSN